jgi:trimeric autotransporter adhesin
MINLKLILRSVGIFVLAVLYLPKTIEAQQNVGIGTTTPNPFSILDISSSNKGLLIPRMALSSTTTNSPVGAFVAGLVIYNTATVSDVTPGYYGCDGSKWVRLANNSGWSLTGNSGVNSATHFIGTTDNQDVVFRRNNIRAGLISDGTNANTSFGESALNSANTGRFNTAFGYGVLGSNTSGVGNLGLGVGVLFNNTTGEGNLGLGFQTLLSNTEGNANIGIGTQALLFNKAGTGGIAIGNEAMKNINNTTTPFNNTNIAIGTSALKSSTTYANNTGLNNIAIGMEAMKNNTSGSNNYSLGHQTLFSNTTGSGNVALGFSSLYHNTDRSSLVGIGDSALYNNGLGATISYHAVRNTAVGGRSLVSNTIGDENTAIGYLSLNKNTEGYFNSALGSKALFSNTTGTNNTATGLSSLYYNIAGYSSTAIGSQSLYSNTYGYENTAIGTDALYNNNIGNRNTAIGTNAMRSLSDGVQNTAIGFEAGYNALGSNNVFIGREAGYNETGSNKLYINSDNSSSLGSLIYGEFDNDKLRINDKLGIGILPISKALEIRGTNATSELMQFYNVSGAAKWHVNLSNGGTSLNFVETGVADNVLVLRPGGNVTIGGAMATGHRLSVGGKIACTEVRVQSASAWPDYVFTENYPLLPLHELEKSITNQKHLPGIPSAKEVESDGIQVGEMQIKMMEKIEELTLYIIDLNKKIELLQSENKMQAQQINTLNKK